MTNLPQTAKPVFSPGNPHWQRIIIEGVREELQPVLTLRDFHYAWTWEVRHRVESDVVFAVLARTWVSVWAYVFKKRLREKVSEVRSWLKTNDSAKVPAKCALDVRELARMDV